MMRVLVFLAVCLSAFVGFFFSIAMAGAVLAHWTTPAIGMSFEVFTPLFLAFLWERRRGGAS